MPDHASRGSNTAPAAARLVKLDALRGLAACYVLVTHIVREPRFVALRFGQEAVMLFFLLSGFVIHHATCVRGAGEQHFGAYLIRRVRRIYPLFLVALAATYASAWLYRGHLPALPAAELVGNLAMLQDLIWVKSGTWFAPFFGNTPLWSLAYEWWFYLLFYPLMLGVAGDARRLGLVAALGAAGFVLNRTAPNPFANYLSYFPIWWAGVELSQEHARTGTVTWRGQTMSLAILAGMAGLWLATTVVRARAGFPISAGFEPALQFRHTTAAATMLVVAIAWYKASFIGFDWLIGPFARLAGVSYAIYVLHNPMLRLTAAIRGVPRPVTLAFGIAALLGVGYLIEVRLQAVINRATAPWLRSRPRAMPLVAETSPQLP